jgi:hypothetical protein
MEKERPAHYFSWKERNPTDFEVMILPYVSNFKQNLCCPKELKQKNKCIQSMVPVILVFNKPCFLEFFFYLSKRDQHSVCGTTCIIQNDCTLKIVR